jgi:hypothetical protein
MASVADRSMTKRIIGIILMVAVGLIGGRLLRVMWSHAHPKPAIQAPASNQN